MIKNFVVACLIAIAMPALALIPNVPEASKSLGLNNNTAKSEILGGGAIGVSGEGFDTYETIRDSDTNYAAKITGGHHPHGGRLLEDADTAWSFLTVVNVGGAQNNRSIIWSIGKKSTQGIALLYSKTDKQLQLAKWTTTATIETVASINLSDDQSQYRSILVTCSNNHYVVYVDGENRGTYDGEIAIDRAFYQIGSVNEGAFDAEKGLGILIDEIGVWNQALTDEEARLIASAFPVWPRILSKVIEDGELSLSKIKAETQEKEILELTMTVENPVIIVDTTLPGITTIKPTFNGILTIKKAQDGISDSEFGEMLAKFFVNELQLTNLASETNAIKVKANGMLVIEEGATVTCNVDYGENHTLKGIEGAGKLIKRGDGDLRLEKNGDYAINGTTVEIQSGLVTFYKDGSAMMKDPAFILQEGAGLDNYGWPIVTGTLTLESDADVTIFTNTGNGSTGSQNSAQFQGNPSIVKKGKGKINLMCGASNDTAHNNVITSVQIENGTLSFGGSAAKFINAVSGEGALEQSGAGTMTILKVAPETSLKVASGALNNECAAGNGSLNLAGLEIAAGATYTMKSAIDHLNIAKSFYLEGDAHKNWYVTLGDGALIATDPGNPMTLAGLEFGESVKIGKNQSIDSVLANVIKPKKWPNSVTSEDERFAKISYTLEHEASSLIVASTFSAELATIPGMNLADANYRVYLTNLPAGITSDDLRVRITTPYSSSMTKVNKNGDNWYAQFSPSIQNETIGGAYQIKVEIGVNDNNAFVPIKTYDDISLNVRPDHKSWIDEASYDRWNTGTWDTEDEYIKIADGYVQIEGKKVSFVPNGKNEEAATKLHFSVKFGAAMKLEILNAIADDGQIAGVTLVEDGGAISYAAWNPAIGEYVPVISSDKKPIDVKAEHLVEVILTKGGIGYIIDGAALVTKGDKQNAVFSLPKDASIKIAEIDFVGQGAVKTMTADEYSTNLAKLGNTEYSTIEEAIAAAGGANRIEVEPLWNASWSPTPELKDKVIVFTGNHKVNPDTTSGILAENDMVLRPNADGSYSVISKFLTVTIPDPEDINNDFGVFLESVTTNSIHLGWTYDYQSETPALAKAKIVYGDDVAINFSTTLENNGLLVKRSNTKESWTIQEATFKNVRYNLDVSDVAIPVLDKEPVASQKTLAKFGVMKQDVARAESAGILDFTTAADGVTFTVGLLDAEGNDITKIVSEQIGDMVEFSTDLQNWVKVGAENVKVITNDDGVQVMFAQQKDTTSGFYKVVIPAE